MTLVAIGLNHQTAPVDLRERVAFDPGTVPHALSSLRALPAVAEAALLSTCNRTELYAVAEDGVDRHIERADDPRPQEHHAHSASERRGIAPADRLAEDGFRGMGEATERSDEDF